MNKTDLSGLSILLVEDEYLQAREAKAFLERAGARVIGPTAHADEVRGLVAQDAPDAAVIDINLGHGPSFGVAELLRREGVPFIFLTGYDEVPVPAALTAVPRAQKPANEGEVVAMLSTLCGAPVAEGPPRVVIG